MGRYLQATTPLSQVSRALTMLREVSRLVLRARNPAGLLAETCEMAVTVGGYSTAIAALRREGGPELRPIAWRGADLDLTESLCHAVSEATRRPASALSRVLSTGRPFVSNDTSDFTATIHFNPLLAFLGFASTVALPLRVDGEPIGVLVLATEASGAVGEQELSTLNDIADAISYALQSLQHENTVRLLSRFDVRTGIGKHPALGSLTLEHRVRAALESRQFELHYQPKINIVTGAVEGAEALLRWNEPGAGYVMPGEFLPVLEGTGLICDVGDWVIHQAARDSLAWLKAGMPAVRVAVNVSPTQLALPDFMDRFMAAQHSLSGPDWGLDIEITEHTVMDDSAAQVQVLHALHEAGTRIAIDDFGMGYSSLARLGTLPVDTLKIDRSFVLGLTQGRKGRALTQAIIELARGLGMTTVAEGVEEPRQLSELLTLGCNQYQGFLHSRPMTADAWARSIVDRHDDGV